MVVAHDGSLSVYENAGSEFSATGDGRLRADGAVWDPVAGASDDGRTLSRWPVTTLFAFAWQDDHGPDGFWTADA